jgi:protein SCO1/2
MCRCSIRKRRCELSQSVVNQPVGDFTLLDRNEKPVRLADYRGKPLLVSFIYTGCFEVCPTTTRNLQKAVTNTVAVLGTDRFNVVSIGFNQPFDSPSAMKAFAAQNGIVFPNWEFLSPAPAIVDELTKSLRLQLCADAGRLRSHRAGHAGRRRGKDLSPDLRRAAGADQLVEPMKQLVTGAPVAQTGAIADILDRVRILCSVYDPKTGQYRVDYALIFEIAGFLTFFLYIAWYVGKGLRSRKPPAFDGGQVARLQAHIIKR